MGPLGDPAALVDLAVRAERAGWDGVFLWDHLVSSSMPIVDTWTTLGAIAAATERIQLGPMVTPVPRRRPWVVARQASTVSRLSHGRLVLGAGLGVDETGDLSRFGEQLDVGERAAMLDEGLDIMRSLWSGAEVQHHGRHHDVEVEASPAEPHPIPIWIASSTAAPGVLRRAVRADGIFHNPGGQLTPEDIASLLVALHDAGLPGSRLREPGVPAPGVGPGAGPGARDAHLPGAAGPRVASFDVAVCGNASAAWGDWPSVDLAGLARAGMTWWMETLIYFDPLALSLEVVDAGPPSA
jgi:hypothetical protein